MAREVDAYGARARIRRPLALVGLNVLTLGVYGTVWYYRANVELREFGRAYGDSKLAASRPGMSLLAVVIGAIVVLPAIVSLIGFVGRVRRAQRYGRSELLSGWLVAVLLCSLVFIPAIPGYVQSSLNELWRRYRAPQRPDSPAAAWTEDAASDAELAAAPPPHPLTALG